MDVKPIKPITIKIGHTYVFTEVFPEVLAEEPREFTARVVDFDGPSFLVRQDPDHGHERIYYKHIKSAVEVETPDDAVTHLMFIYDRMVQGHGDRHDADYIVRFQEVIAKVAKRRDDYNNLLATLKWADMMDGADTIAEHPDYPKESWRCWTRDGDTFKSYKDWVLERAARNEHANGRPRS